MLACPGCHGSIRFEETGSWAVVCPVCDALVLRDGTRHAASTDHMPLVEDLSPLQIGAKGTMNELYFKITGRIRVEGQRGYRNFWSMKGDTPYTWLLQAYGNYALMALDEALVPPKAFKGVDPGKKLKIDGGFELEALDNRFKYAWEGELMHQLPLPWDIELEGGEPGGGRVLILVDRSRDARALKGVSIEFNALRLENPNAWAQWS